MRRIIIGVLFSMLVLSSGMGAFTAATTQEKIIEPEPIDYRDYSHNIFAEFFTMTTCVPCKYVHAALVNLYDGEYHPFYYITYVYNKNNNSRMRKNELQVVGSPTTDIDGKYERLTGGGPTTEERMEEINESILICGARTVNDIDLSLNVEWQGAVNINPIDEQTLVPIEVICNWTISEMKIEVEATSHEVSQYNGHLHVQVTEADSEWWDDKFGDPYTFEFKDYAYNKDVTLNESETFSETIYWDGCDYNDADDPPRYFDHIEQDNIMIVAAMFDRDNNKYVDETAGFLAGEGTDPKTFDVYFGDINPPPIVISNGTAMKYDPSPFGDLNWSTTYYWKLDVWNAKGEKTAGELMEFTTRGNVAPNEPQDVYPKNNSEDIPIDANLKWLGGDQDGDEVEYDIYFGEHDPFEPWTASLVESDWEETEYDPTPIGTLDFETEYEWKIIAEDEYGEVTEGPWWKFKTEPNYPPNPAKNPRPPDGATNVSVNAILYWNGTDPNSGDTLKYDVYFGLYEPPTLQENNQTEAWYDPYGPDGEMQLFETYYWKIVTWDKEGLRSENNKVWSFETGLNPPPSNPDIDGPTEGTAGEVYNFTFVSDDINNDSIYYEIDWDGNLVVDETTELYPHATPVTRSHSWPEQGEYTIRIRAVDQYHEPSGWSEHPFNNPRSRSVDGNHNIFNWMFERFPNLFPILRYLFGL
jgi:hypothetical protein